MTNLGRLGSPVIRYRTGDLVIRVSEPCRCGRTLARLDGGILSRVDDMVCIRGVNVYPSAIEAVIRTAREVVEYRASVQTDGALGSLSVEIEVEATEPDPRTVARRVADKLKEALGLTVSVAVVGPESSRASR